MKDGVQHLWLPHWLAQAGHCDAAPGPQALRATLQGLGLRARPLRLYTLYGDRLFKPLGRRWLSRAHPVGTCRNVLDYLSLLQACETDVPPPPLLVSALAACVPEGQALAVLPAPVFRNGWQGLAQASYRGLPEPAFVSGEFVPAVRWFFASGAAPGYDANQARAGWPWLLERWRLQERTAAAAQAPQEWASPLSGMQALGCAFIALCSPAALTHEGQTMRHCIDKYTKACRLGRCHVYSVCDAATRQPLATLALGGDGRAWGLVGLRARANGEPTRVVAAAAAAFLRLLARHEPPAPADAALRKEIADPLATWPGSDV